MTHHGLLVLIVDYFPCDWNAVFQITCVFFSKNVAAGVNVCFDFGKTVVGLVKVSSGDFYALFFLQLLPVLQFGSSGRLIIEGTVWHILMSHG